MFRLQIFTTSSVFLPDVDNHSSLQFEFECQNFELWKFIQTSTQVQIWLVICNARYCRCMIPVCIFSFQTAVDCGTLTNPANGQVTTTGTTFGQNATYSCNTGYNLVGSSTRTCQATESWSGSVPTCQSMLYIRLFWITGQADTSELNDSFCSVIT